MDVISIAEMLWRRKVVTIPVLLLTLLGAFYVIKVKAPVYQAQSSLLIVPPGTPTSSQIAADPALAKINPNNPYVTYNDLSVVADTVIDVVTDPASEQSMAAQGADPGYSLQLSTDYGNPPIIDITGIGKTPQIAMRSAELVTKAAQADLLSLQRTQGVNSYYMITGTQLITPTQATTSVSGKLRTLIAVLSVGLLVLFAGVSLVEALERRRRGQAGGARARQREPEREPQRQEEPRAGLLHRYRTRPGWAPSAPGSALPAGESQPLLRPDPQHSRRPAAVPAGEPRPARGPVAPPPVQARPTHLPLRGPAGPPAEPGPRRVPGHPAAAPRSPGR
jgi:capsular polysaccharide biosynthesis protein